MPGIAGFFVADPHERVPPLVGDRLAATLSTAVPTACIGWGDPRIALGGRVACNENRTVQAVFCGTIFNALDLRRKLTEAGHRLDSESEAEVASHGFEEWGFDGLLERLDGNFAFCLWDTRSRTAYLARDPLGVSSLFYIDRNRRFAFGSELTSLLQTGLLNGQVDEVALWGYLRYQYVPGERTLLAGVRQLGPGECLHWHEGMVTIRRYWDVASASASRQQSPDLRRIPEQLHALLTTSVEKHARDATRIGCLLDGSVGSALLATLLAPRGQVQTFSVSYADDAEKPANAEVAAIASQLGMPHEPVTLGPQTVLNWIAAGGPWRGDQPSTDVTTLPLLLVGEPGVPIDMLFAAAGADEFFAGHSFYRARTRRYRLEQFHEGLRRAAEMIAALTDTLHASRRLGCLTLHPGGAEASPFTGRPYLFRDDFLWALLHPERRPDGQRFRECLDRLEKCPLATLSEPTGLQAAQCVESRLWLAGKVVPQLRQLSRNSGWALRVPYLDPAVAAFAFGLPEEALIGREPGPRLLLDVSRQLMSDGRCPQGTSAACFPLASWLRNELHALVRETLVGTLRPLELFDTAVLQFLAEDREPLTPPLAQCVWNLLVFGRWHERVRAEIAAANQQLQECGQCIVPRSETVGVETPQQALAEATPPGPLPRCDIAIPVYEGVGLVRDLLRSIENYTDPTVTPYHIWLIDDGSDPNSFARLQELAADHPWLTLTRNEKNLGFVATANRGLASGTAPFVVLLNTDTLVTPGWLERLIRCALSDDRIALVNPLSNRSDNLSVELPPGLGLETIAAKVAEAPPSYPDIVTVVGFCLLVKRKYLDWLGGLDPIFGMGYCEESDLHMRFREAGLRAVLADDAYVYHMGHGSFGPVWQERYQVNRKIFDARWEDEYWRDLKASQRAAPIERVQHRLLENTVAMAGKYERALEIVDEIVGEPTWTVDLPVGDYSFSKRHWQHFVHYERRRLGRRRKNGDDRQVYFPSAPYVRRLPRTKGMRITFLLYGLESSGGILSIVQLAREWMLAGHDVQFVTTITDAQNLWPERVNLPCQPLIYPSEARLVRDFPESDIVIPTFWLTAYRWLPQLQEKHVFRSVYYVQDYEAWFYPDEHPDRQRVIETFGMTDQRVVKSQWLADLLAAHGHDSIQIHQGIDLDIFYPRQRRPHSRPRILACARPHEPRRGFMQLLGIFARLHSLRPDVELCFYGCSDAELKHFDPPFPYTNYQRIYDLNRVARLQGDCDILIDPSLYQAFGMPGLEAMACGTATVLPNIGGILEYAVDLENTLLVSPADEQAAVAALLRLLDDRELREHLVHNGFKQPPRFCHRDEARLHLELYERLLQQRGAEARLLSAAG